MPEPRDAEPAADDAADAVWFRELVEPILEDLPIASCWDSVCRRLSGESN